MALERLQKILAQAGVSSRRSAERLITDGRVRVNGRIVSELGARANPLKDRVEVDGKRLVAEKPVYYLMHKPRGVVTTLDDPEGRASIADLLREVPERVFPVGRLDFQTSGALLLTNDGGMAQALLHPTRRVPKVYHAKVQGTLDSERLELLRNGVTLDDGEQTAAADVDIVRKDEKHTFIQVTISEGKNRQIHRMLDAVGRAVLRLTRTAFADLALASLRPGELRPLTQPELSDLKQKYLNPSKKVRGPRGADPLQLGAEEEAPLAQPRERYRGFVQGGAKRPERKTDLARRETGPREGTREEPRAPKRGFGQREAGGERVLQRRERPDSTQEFVQRTKDGESEPRDQRSDRTPGFVQRTKDGESGGRDPRSDRTREFVQRTKDGESGGRDARSDRTRGFAQRGPARDYAGGAQPDARKRGFVQRGAERESAGRAVRKGGFAKREPSREYAGRSEQGARKGGFAKREPSREYAGRSEQGARKGGFAKRTTEAEDAARGQRRDFNRSFAQRTAKADIVVQGPRRDPKRAFGQRSVEGADAARAQPRDRKRGFAQRDAKTEGVARGQHMNRTHKGPFTQRTTADKTGPRDDRRTHKGPPYAQRTTADKTGPRDDRRTRKGPPYAQRTTADKTGARDDRRTHKGPPFAQRKTADKTGTRVDDRRTRKDPRDNTRTHGADRNARTGQRGRKTQRNR